ncbi:mandelate racemase/muconate lactonizing enzyme family protein [Jannaschia formosa]|uniref:mandelate racemase/muconate lactonizing enzyme family protein n=1 Tax=Jannaschia formosa TaxID=2259592 RepID=UPI000E1B9E5A|nr:mandelate racemase/muconate lactonizing enzyme family protein [Jannaschia formosa]TFL16358.1 mandelate racemase/muconate lactonizing enzyme family protein [Jannaschia formosa]
MLEPVIRSIRPRLVDVSNKTTWTFVEVETEDGLIGTGEATVNGHADALASLALRADKLLAGVPATRISGAVATVSMALDSFTGRAVSCAVEQALWDIAAQRAEQPLHTLLGGAMRETVPIYANINRAPAERSGKSFAQAARNAVEAGYRYIKMAPFDEVDYREYPLSGPAAMQPGLDRLAAAREELGSDAALMVDAHWRFDEASAMRLIAAAAELELIWVECPVPETPDAIKSIRRLRAEANRRGMWLAGCERETSLERLLPYLQGGCYDVIMPDVKYVGGLTDLLTASRMAAAFSTRVAPHNPTGPVCHMASLHASAAAPADGFLMLEHQLGESPLFFDAVDGIIPAVTGLADGACTLPEAPGLGIAIRKECCR